MVFLIKVTMLILRPSARHSTSALLMDRAVLPSTASSAPTEPSSTRTTSSATGGSTLTAMRLRVSIPRTRRLLLSERLPLQLHQTRLLTELLLLLATLQELLLQLILARPLLLLHPREHIRVLREQAGSLATGGTTGGEEGSSKVAMEDSEDNTVCYSHLWQQLPAFPCPELTEWINMQEVMNGWMDSASEPEWMMTKVACSGLHDPSLSA